MAMEFAHFVLSVRKCCIAGGEISVKFAWKSDLPVWLLASLPKWYGIVRWVGEPTTLDGSELHLAAVLFVSCGVSTDGRGASDAAADERASW